MKEKDAKIYAFSSIMRISNNNYNEEEKEYWKDYGCTGLPRQQWVCCHRRARIYDPCCQAVHSLHRYGKQPDAGEADRGNAQR